MKIRTVSPILVEGPFLNANQEQLFHCSQLKGSHALVFPKVLAQIPRCTVTCIEQSIHLEWKSKDPS